MTKLIAVSIILAFCTQALGCVGTRPCHDGPVRPYGSQSIQSLLGGPSLQSKTYAPKKLKSLARRSEDLYEFLEARGYFDNDDDLYARDADSFDEAYVNLPVLPLGVDPRGQHLFVRLNTIPKAYPPFGNVDHSGLNKLMFDLGGQHVDVAYGNPSQGYRECGMALVDMAWTTTHPNADGYPIHAQCSELWPGERDKYTYMGRLQGHNITELSRKLLNGRTYDHKSFHCGTFVRRLLGILGFQ